MLVFMTLIFVKSAGSSFMNSDFLMFVTIGLCLLVRSTKVAHVVFSVQHIKNHRILVYHITNDVNLVQMVSQQDFFM